MRCTYDNWKGKVASKTSRTHVTFCECALCRSARTAKSLRTLPTLAAVRERLDLLQRELDVPLDKDDEVEAS